MKYTGLISAIPLALGALLLTPGVVTAGWGHHFGGSYGSYGSSGGYAAYSSYGSSGGYARYSRYSAYFGSSGYAASYGSSGGYSTGYASYGGSSGGFGPLRGLLQRVHGHLAAKRARHAARRAAYGSSGGYYGSSGYAASYGSSGGYSSYGGGSSGGYGTGYSNYRSYYGGSSGHSTSYGSTGSASYGSTGSSLYYGASVSSDSTVRNLVSNSRVIDDAVYLTVAVPSSAKIYVNDRATSSTGAVRQFVSRGLEAGKTYGFTIRAELKAADGEVLSESRTITVQAGERQELQFAFQEDAGPIETALTVNVPEDAEVTLAGNKTTASGTVRTFRTTSLKPGDSWDDYEVEVRLGDRVRRQSVRLIGGDNLQLSFDFDDSSDRIAAR